MPHKNLKIGDRVVAYNPDLPVGEKEFIEGIITGKQLMKIAVDFGRRADDIWPYDVTEVKKVN